MQEKKKTKFKEHNYTPNKTNKVIVPPKLEFKICSHIQYKYIITM